MSQLDEKQSEVDSSDFSSMKVAELRDLLKEKNLSTQGRKADLIARLEESNKSNQSETNSDIEDENTDENSSEQNKEKSPKIKEEKQELLPHSDYSMLKVAELKELLTSKNLPTSGRKADLISRLRESEQSSAKNETIKDNEKTIIEENEIVKKKEITTETPSPLQQFLMSKKASNIYYPIFHFMIIGFISLWVANGLGLFVDGTGGSIVYEGHTDANGNTVSLGNYSVCDTAPFVDSNECQGTVQVGEKYPCDPSIDDSNCANTLTPFLEHSSMPKGFYADGIFMITFGFILLGCSLYLDYIHAPNLRMKFGKPGNKKSEIEVDEKAHVNEQKRNQNNFSDLVVLNPTDKPLSVSETLGKYDENDDGKMDHFEFIDHHSDEVENKGLAGIFDRFLDDDPQMRGQRLWVMFSLSLILVAAMNAYAMIREPSTVSMGDIVEYNNEVVAVEGIITSWVEDPYGSGDNRVDIIIEDQTGVVELRWYRYGEIPPLGTYVRAIGDVIEYDGRIWLQALGAGAVTWGEGDVPEIYPVTISEVARDPQNYSEGALTLYGYLSKSIEPDASFSALYIGDHPNYANSDHQLRMVIHSAPNQWLESGQKVEVTGILEYEPRELRWTLHVQGPEVRTIGSHEVPVALLDWSNKDTWSYSANSLVEISGTLIEGWSLVGSNQDSICIIPETEFNQTFIDQNLNQVITFQGRLLWSISQNEWCIDGSSDSRSTAGVVAVGDAVDLWGMISADHVSVLGDMEKTYTVMAYSKYSIAPFSTSITLVDAPDYSQDWTSISASFPGSNSWIESGQLLILNLTVGWDDANARINLNILDFVIEGSAPEPEIIYWEDGATSWSYERNNIVQISGEIISEEGQYYLQREGSEQKIRITPVLDAIGLNENYENYTLTWQGRLSQYDDNQNMAQSFSLDAADVVDADGNGIPDELEA
ncbi:MAG: hypothetical protein CMA84_04485 [Euryarchaeota archaeon]|nr:hypothetical protein [Euryarchaeota archaeon]